GVFYTRVKHVIAVNFSQRKGFITTRTRIVVQAPNKPGIGDRLLTRATDLRAKHRAIGGDTGYVHRLQARISHRRELLLTALHQDGDEQQKTKSGANEKSNH